MTGVSELKPLADAGRIRIIGVTSAQPLKGVNIPTLTSAGLDITVSNWRGVVGAPGMSEAAKAEWISRLDKLSKTPSWPEATAEATARGGTAARSAATRAASAACCSARWSLCRSFFARRRTCSAVGKAAGAEESAIARRSQCNAIQYEVSAVLCRVPRTNHAENNWLLQADPAQLNAHA